MISLISLLFPILPSIALAASGKGEVSLWSNSDCGQGDTSNFGERNPVALNYTLSADVCGNPGATVRSYEVTQRPICDNGTVAAWAFFAGEDCKTKGFGSALNGFSTSTFIDGQCLALVEFNSVAFICDGVGSGEENQKSSSSAATPPSSSSPASEKPITPSTTRTAKPITPSTTRTSPLYTVPASTSLHSSTAAHSGTGPSAKSPASTTLSAKPSPPPSSFTGAGSRFGVSFIGAIVAAGGVFIL